MSRNLGSGKPRKIRLAALASRATPPRSLLQSPTGALVWLGADVRTSVQDEVIYSGRLSAFARALGKEDLDALGWLVFAWHDTQNAHFISGKRPALKRLLSVRFGAEADRVIDALLDSLLADIRREKIEIRGNRAHVNKLVLLRQIKVNGGKKRASNASRRKDGTFHPADDQQTTSSQPAETSYITTSPSTTTSKSEECAPAFDPYEPRTNPAALEFEKYYLSKKPGSLLTALPPKERIARDELLRLTGNPQAAHKVLDHYLADNREFYRKVGHRLQTLVDNIGEHDGASVAAPKIKTPADAINAGIAERREEAGRALPPEEALKAMRKLGLVS